MANINVPPIETGDAYSGLLNVYRISATALKGFNKFLWSKMTGTGIVVAGDHGRAII